MSNYNKHNPHAEENIIRHLLDDFQVDEFLRKNRGEGTEPGRFSSNEQEYAKVINKVSLQLHQHRQFCDALIRTTQDLRKQQNNQSLLTFSRKAQPQADLSMDCQTDESEAIRNKISYQMQTKQSLEKEIIQAYKSLNLLKGDIGHLINRQQSAKIIQSKIAKVKIVAEDQLKRVELAYSKDNEEEAIRVEMQKMFSKNLKKVANIESNYLAKVKNYFCDGVDKKQKLFAKLSQSEKHVFTASRFEEVLRRKGQADNLTNIVKRIVQQTADLVHCATEDEQSKAVHKLQTHQQAELLISEYRKLNSQLERKVEEHEESAKRQTQKQSQFLQLETRITKLIAANQADCQAEAQKKAREEEKSANLQYLRRLRGNICAILKVLSLNTNLGGPEKETHRCVSQLVQSFMSLFKGEEVDGDIKMSSTSSPDIIQAISALLKPVPLSFRVKQSPMEAEGRTRRLSESSSTKSEESEDQLIMNNGPKSIEQSQGATQGSKGEKTQDRAKRIELLESVDNDYYKMIKSTLKLEKENTCKNYHFLRNFKRTKYVSRDKILEEKRFQASFSGLFTCTRKDNLSTMKASRICITRIESPEHKSRYDQAKRSSIEFKRTLLGSKHQGEENPGTSRFFKGYAANEKARITRQKTLC